MKEIICQKKEGACPFDIILETEKLTGGLPDERMEITHAKLLRHLPDRTEAEPLVLFDYTWPRQLKVDIRISDVENPEQENTVRFQMHITAHHITGMAQGEFSETEYLEIQNPGSDPICTVTDITRKTRFALAERHLEHLPHQTYPSADGRQGPYGHPVVRTEPSIPRRPHHPTAG